MRRTGLTGIAAGVLLAAGCRHSCGDRCAALPPVRGAAPTSLTAGTPGCRDGILASADRSDLGQPLPGWGPSGSDAFGPSYPSGVPMPIGPGTTAPGFDSPLPTIPSPGVPATPTPAQPGANVLPPPSVRLTGSPTPLK